MDLIVDHARHQHAATRVDRIVGVDGDRGIDIGNLPVRDQSRSLNGLSTNDDARIFDQRTNNKSPSVAAAERPR